MRDKSKRQYRNYDNVIYINPRQERVRPVRVARNLTELTLLTDLLPTNFDIWDGDDAA